MLGVLGAADVGDTLPMYHDWKQMSELGLLSYALQTRLTGTQPRSPESSFTAWVMDMSNKWIPQSTMRLTYDQ